MTRYLLNQDIALREEFFRCLCFNLQKKDELDIKFEKEKRALIEEP